MKPKNVMLLGFVNRAADYLDRHMDEEPDARLAELKNIDLEALKEELADNLDTSLGTMQSTMAALLKAGNEAFDKFIVDNSGKFNIQEEFSRLFDVDLEGNEDSKQSELAKLLSFYNLDSFDENKAQEISNTRNVVTNNRPVQNKPQQKAQVVQQDNDVEESKPALSTSEDKTAEIDSLFNEIVENENIKPIEFNEPEPENEEGGYVSSLVEDMKKRFAKEEEARQEVEKNYQEIYDQLASIYTHLDQNFIKSAYSLKEEIANAYPFDKSVVVLHRVKFKDVAKLRNFVEIILNHDYLINADEKKLIVDVFKEFMNGEGKILSNIFEIANQGSVLDGTYEGYNVMVNN